MNERAPRLSSANVPRFILTLPANAPSLTLSNILRKASGYLNFSGWLAIKCAPIYLTDPNRSSKLKVWVYSPSNNNSQTKHRACVFWRPNAGAKIVKIATAHTAAASRRINLQTASSLSVATALKSLRSKLALCSVTATSLCKSGSTRST